jgi:hypothetical protein
MISAGRHSHPTHNTAPYSPSHTPNPPTTQELRPDILNLCEVEGCDEVAWLAEKLNAEEAQEEEEAAGGGYGYYLVRMCVCLRRGGFCGASSSR